VGPSKVVLVTRDGTICGYNPHVDATSAVMCVSKPAKSFTGCALTKKHLFVTEFRCGRIEKYDSSFQLLGTFTDYELLQRGLSPYNIKIVQKKWLFVTFAQQDHTGHHAMNTNGAIGVFNMKGDFVMRFASGGPLHAPWGLAVVPGHTHTTSVATHSATTSASAKKHKKRKWETGCMLLVGNAGNGTIASYDLDRGHLLSLMRDCKDEKITLSGLFGMSFNAGENGKEALYLVSNPPGVESGVLIEIGCCEKKSCISRAASSSSC
jgi:hypothetical protein